MKLTTILLLTVVLYICYTYVKRYQEMEREIEELREKCAEIEEEVPESTKVSGKVKEWVDGLSGLLQSLLLSMPE